MIQVNLDQLDMLYEEQQYQIAILKLWAIAEKAGHAAESVRAFTYLKKFLTEEEELEDGLHFDAYRTWKYIGVTHHNALRLKDDTLVPIPLTLRPEIPNHMKTSFREAL